MDDEPLTTNQPPAFTNSFYDGLVASNSRLTFKSKSTSLPCLGRACVHPFADGRVRPSRTHLCFGRTDLFVCEWMYVHTRTGSLDKLHRRKDNRIIQPFTLTCSHILIFTLSLVDAYHKESRQKRLPVKLGQTNLLLVRLAKYEAENKTQKCKIFNVFIRSFQLKSPGKTNILVHRGEFTSSLLCLTNSLYGLVSSNSRLTFIPRTEPREIRTFTSSLLCLYMCDGFLTNKPQITIIFDNLTSNDQIRTYSYLSRILILLAECYKESRQKRLVVKHGKYNSKTALMQYFIDTAANLTRICSLGVSLVDSLNSRKHNRYVRSNLARLKRYSTKFDEDNLTSERICTYLS